LRRDATREMRCALCDVRGNLSASVWFLVLRSPSGIGAGGIRLLNRRIIAALALLSIVLLLLPRTSSERATKGLNEGAAIVALIVIRQQQRNLV
jgi:hypothetical protein